MGWPSASVSSPSTRTAGRSCGDRSRFRSSRKLSSCSGLLVTRQPKALSKAQIRDVVWPGTFVSETTLAGLVADLRSALGDNAQQPRFIRTVHGFGYAFCGSTAGGGTADPQQPRDAGSSGQASRFSFRTANTSSAATKTAWCARDPCASPGDTRRSPSEARARCSRTSAAATELRWRDERFRDRSSSWPETPSRSGRKRSCSLATVRPARPSPRAADRNRLQSSEVSGELEVSFPS